MTDTGTTTDPASAAASPPHLLVLGAGPGLGAAIARRFGREGFTVTLLGRTPERLEALAADLREQDGLTVDVAVADAADPGAFEVALERLAQRGTPDVVVYNAALLSGDDALTSSSEELLRAHSINVLGAITAARVFSPGMRTAGHGTLLATGGGLGLAPDPEFATMSIGKAGLRAAMTLLHQQLEGAGVHVASVTVAGNIAADTAFDPALIAESYWTLHAEPQERWSTEILFDGR